MMLQYGLDHARVYIFQLIEGRKLALKYLTSKVNKKYDVQFISLLISNTFYLFAMPSFDFVATCNDECRRDVYCCRNNKMGKSIEELSFLCVKPSKQLEPEKDGLGASVALHIDLAEYYSHCRAKQCASVTHLCESLTCVHPS
jgi:hypothetical protein